MQIETKYCLFAAEQKAAYVSPYTIPLVAAMCESCNQARMGAVTFEKNLDFMATPFFFLHNTACRESLNIAVADCHQLGCDAVLVVGIGGSSLGASAVYDALRRSATVPIYFLETIDPDQYGDLKKLVDSSAFLHVVIISKSGSTLETGVNSAFAIDMVRKQHPDNWKQYVTVISDHESPLSEFAQKEGFRWLGIPDAVGGRFSVFAMVALFPLALAGIDVRAFCDGACQELDDFCQKGSSAVPVLSAQMLYVAYQTGYWVHDTFLWDRALEGLGKWYRQLCAESLGKRQNLAGEVVEVGILPTVSIGTQDLHSMLQLYLGGPHHIVTTFVIPASCSPLNVPRSGWEMAQYEGKDVASIRDAIIKGVQTAYAEERRPFMTIMLDKSARDLGHFMMMKMLETVLLGALLEVNPFDQPEVEKYKRAAHQFLAQLR